MAALKGVMHGKAADGHPAGALSICLHASRCRRSRRRAGWPWAAALDFARRSHRSRARRSRFTMHQLRHADGQQVSVAVLEARDTSPGRAAPSRWSSLPTQCLSSSVVPRPMTRPSRTATASTSGCSGIDGVDAPVLEQQIRGRWLCAERLPTRRPRTLPQGTAPGDFGAMLNPAVL